MSDLLDEEWNRHVAQMLGMWMMEAKEHFSSTSAEKSRPCVLFRPKLSIDGDMWCALYGENLQDGVAGFGKSPSSAMLDFDKNWSKDIPDDYGKNLDHMLVNYYNHSIGKP